MSSYQRKHPKDPQNTSFQAEAALIGGFNSLGIRAEPATDFEDEFLGVDVWTFLFDPDPNTWAWFPIDVTLRRDMDPFKGGSKYDTAFGRGVIPISLDPGVTASDITYSLVRTIGGVLDDFRTCDKEVLTRKRAMQEELKDFPLT